MVDEIQAAGGRYPTQRVLKVGSSDKRSVPASRPAEQADRVEISDLAYWRAKVAALPEIRAEKVAAVREQIANGTYDTEEKLAAAVDRLLDDVMGNPT